MADGSVRLDVDLSLNKAEKQLQTLKGKIAKLESEVNKNTEKKGLLENQMRVTGAQLDDVIDKVKYLKEKVANTKGDKKPLYKEELTEALEEQSILNKEANRLNSEYDKVTGNIASAREKLSEMTKEAGEMEKAIVAARPGERIKEGISDAKKGLKNLLKYAVGIRSLYILVNKIRTGITEGFKDFASKDPETKKNLNDLKASLAGLRGAWGAAFGPIVNAVTPLLKTLISWLTAAGNAVARFFAIISGKSTYKKAVANADNYADALGGVADNAKEARKQLAGIDELTIFSDDKASGGGGGAGGADYIEEATNAGDMSFGSRLAMTVKDVFFDWGDWNAEKILQKAIAFLPAVAGAAIGWGIGGFKGAVLGGLLGLAFGLVVDANSINGDGELDIGEIIKSVLPFGVALTIGKGHPIIGLVAGLALSFFLENKELSSKSIGDVVTQIRSYFGQYIQKWLDADGGKDTPGWTAFAIVAGIIEGLYQAGKTYFPQIKEKLIDPLMDTVKKQLGITSFSEVFAKIGEKIVDGLLQGVKNKWQSFKQDFVTKFEDLKARLGEKVEKIKGLFNFSFKVPHIPSPHISWETYSGGWASALLHFFGVDRIPKISWYARGGIVDGATLIGAGEAGAEAIIPLERNTEWINLVADGIIDRITSSAAIERLASAFARVPLPAMANGAVIPPNATARAGGLSDEGMAYLISQITSAVYANANLIVNAIANKDMDFSVDGMSFARKMYSYNQRVAVEHGNSLINH